MKQPMIIGQDDIITRVRTWIYTGDKVNVLFRGFAGSGKTLIARYYAGMIARDYYHYHMCTGVAISLPDDDEPVILDEIHRLKKEEMWYDFSPMVGCTTEGSPISDPLKSRMVELWMAEYSLQELTTIVMNATGLPPLSASIAATRGRGSPRTSIQVGNEARRALAFNRISEPTKEQVSSLCHSMGYLSGGFTPNDLRYLEILSGVSAASAATIAATLNLPRDTIQTEIEPFLMRQGLVRITSRGRELCPGKQLPMII